MLDAASRCVRCGYEIREKEDDDFASKRYADSSRREGIVYSSFAQFSLEIWALLAVLGIVVALGVTVLALFNGEWLRAFLGLVSSWGNFALYALLQRVADMND